MKHHHTQTERQQYIDRYISGETIASIIDNAKIVRSTLFAWARNYRKFEQKSEQPTEKTVFKLNAQIKSLEEKIIILKTVDCTAKSSLREKLFELERFYGQYSVKNLCEALDVSRGTFYNHVLRNKREDTTYTKRRDELSEKIKEIFHNNKQIFGAGKIVALLQNDGYKVSIKMVRQLMRDQGLSSIRQDSKQIGRAHV